MVNRLNHDHYFLMMAKVASLRSTCFSRQVGAVLVDENNYVLATGYNGPPKGVGNCDPCKRLNSNVGEGLLDRCMAVHAEQNALLQCPDMRAISTIYATVSPCLTCIKLLLNTPCKRIVFMDYYLSSVMDLWTASGRYYEHVIIDPGAKDIIESMSLLPKLLSK